ncbi:MAG TPA: ATP-binding cassette domain-containing protein, partial [Alphaproteobacteria bacterium]|nr:ATP-binding cassette domain-containing protein [Alphaproteobacteria bacterium]
MASLIIRNLTKRYWAVEVLKGIDIALADGEFLVLLGPSGCGKTTLLRMIAGLEEPTAGEIYIDDMLVNFTPPKDRDIAMVF